jgi:hypothetical protein
MSNRERGAPSGRPATPNLRQLAPNVGRTAVVAAPPTVHHHANTMMQLIDFTDSSGPPPLTPYDVASTVPSTVVRSPVSSTHPSSMDSAMRTRRHTLNPFLDQTVDDQTWLQADSLLHSFSRPALSGGSHRPRVSFEPMYDDVPFTPSWNRNDVASTVLHARRPTATSALPNGSYNADIFSRPMHLSFAPSGRDVPK